MITIEQLQAELDYTGNLIIAQANANHRFGPIIDHEEIMAEFFNKRKDLQQQIRYIKYPQLKRKIDESKRIT